MARNQRRREQLRALCDEPGAEDGLDPRDYFKPAHKRTKESRKSRQLCRQAQKTLELVLSGDVGDDLLNGLKIVSITPLGDGSRLHVTVAADCPANQFDRRAIEDRLARWKGRLRCEVAAAIHRRNVPVLTFQVLGPGWGASGQAEEGRP